jgi:8-oxo-dGTP diphosphatase
MTTTEHFVGKVSLRAVIEKDGKVFVCRGIGDTVWQLPGGRMHEGEEPKEALARELKEELGVDASVGRPLFAQTVLHNKSQIWQLVLVYLAAIGEQEMSIDPAETEESHWFSRQELKELPMFEDCRNAVDEFLKSN